jgi:hypothetical protein
MPTVLREGPYRFFFYSGDRGEPAHVHIERDDKIAKIWLQPVRLRSSGSFTRVEISKILKITEDKQTFFLESWHEYFGV